MVHEIDKRQSHIAVLVPVVRNVHEVVASYGSSRMTEGQLQSSLRACLLQSDSRPRGTCQSSALKASALSRNRTAFDDLLSHPEHVAST